jgi:hypothetical protein
MCGDDTSHRMARLGLGVMVCISEEDGMPNNRSFVSKESHDRVKILERCCVDAARSLVISIPAKREVKIHWRSWRSKRQR